MRRHLCWLRHTHHFSEPNYISSLVAGEISNESWTCHPPQYKVFYDELGRFERSIPIVECDGHASKTNEIKSVRTHATWGAVGDLAWPYTKIHQVSRRSCWHRWCQFTLEPSLKLDIMHLDTVLSCSNRSSVPRQLTNSPFLPSTFSPCPLQLSLLLKIDHLSNCRT